VKVKATVLGELEKKRTNSIALFILDKERKSKTDIKYYYVAGVHFLST
jgi:hypothetical protein